MEIETKVPILNPTEDLEKIFDYNLCNTGNVEFGRAKLLLKSDKYYFSQFYESKKFLRIRSEKIQSGFELRICDFINDCLKRDLPPHLNAETSAVTLTSKDKTVNSHGYEENVEAETDLGNVDVSDLEKTFEVFGFFKKFEKNKLSIMLQLLDEPFNVEFVYAFGDDWTKGKWYCEIETTDELQERCGTKDWCINEMDYRTCEVRFYNVEVDAKDFDSFDAESWLNENTSYNSDCYYMVCNEAIKVSHENAKKYFINTKAVNGEYHKCDPFEEQKPHDAIKEFASEVRKTIEDTYQSFGGSEHFSFEDHGLALIEAVQDKLDEVLK